MGGVSAPNTEVLMSLPAEFCRIALAEASGVLVLEWDKYKKQMAFKKGIPTLIRSNAPEDTWPAYLVKASIISKAILLEQMKKKESAQDKRSLPEWLLSEGHLNPGQMPELYQNYLLYRLFNQLEMPLKSLRFQAGAIEESESGVPSRDWLRFLWDELLKRFEDPKSKVKAGLATFSDAGFHMPESPPVQLKPQELRIWNRWKERKLFVKDIEASERGMFCVLRAFGVLSLEEAPKLERAIPRIEDMEEEMRKLEAQLPKLNHYELLGVGLDATDVQLKEAYHEFIRRYHPDRLSPTASADLKRLSETLFARINTAFSVLSDPAKKQEYMAELELQKLGGLEGLQARLDAEFQIPQAQIALKKKQFSEALNLLKKIEQVLPDDPEVIADRVFSEFMEAQAKKQNLSSRLDSFLKDLARSMQIRENYAPAHYYEGMILKMKSQGDAALQAFERALSLDPKLTEAASEARLLKTKPGKKK